MIVKTTRYDTADYLETAEDVSGYLEAAFEGGDASHIRAALNDVARSRGMTEIADKTGLTADAIRSAIDEGLKLDGLLKIVSMLDLQVVVKAIPPSDKGASS